MVTNQFTASGGFSYTNVIQPNLRAQCFRVIQPWYRQLSTMNYYDNSDCATADAMTGTTAILQRLAFSLWPYPAAHHGAALA